MTSAGLFGDAELTRRVGLLCLEQKVRLLTGADFWALYAEPEAGLRRVVTSDGPAGVRGESWDERDTSANIPSATALAATWDTVRVAAIGELLAREARRKGVDVLLAPTVNLHRTPYGGRHFECFSEDPVLTARIGAAYVQGLQRCGVAATVKHFVGNDSETQRMTVDVRIDERTLRELYLAPFEEIVREAAPWAVMAGYNGVNGSTMTESPLLRDILHREWGYDGLVMSDSTATRSVAAAARSALDLAMPGPASRYGPWGDELVEAVRAGQVDEALIDDKVRRILRLAARVGALAAHDRHGRCAARGAGSPAPAELPLAAPDSPAVALSCGPPPRRVSSWPATTDCSRWTGPAPADRPGRRHRAERRTGADPRRRQRHRLPRRIRSRRWTACVPLAWTWPTPWGYRSTCGRRWPGPPGCCGRTVPGPVPRSGSSPTQANWPDPSSVTGPCSAG